MIDACFILGNTRQISFVARRRSVPPAQRLAHLVVAVGCLLGQIFDNLDLI